MAAFDDVSANFTAQDVATDAMRTVLDGLHHVSVHIETGDLVGSVVLEVRRPGGVEGSVYEIIETYSSFPVWRTVEIAGGWDFRLRCSAYSSGSSKGWLVA